MSLYIYPLLFPPPKVLLLFISPWFPCITSSSYFCLLILYSFLLSSCFPSFFILLPTYHTTARARPRWCSFLLLSYPGFNLILNSHSIILSKVPLQAVGYNNSPTNNKRGKALSPGKHQPRGGYAEIPITNRAKRKLLSTVSLLSAITENFAKLSTHSFGPLNLLVQPFLTGSKSSLSFFSFYLFLSFFQQRFHCLIRVNPKIILENMMFKRPTCLQNRRNGGGNKNDWSAFPVRQLFVLGMSSG